jgi:hypothetical protein
MYTSSSQQVAWSSEHRNMLYFTKGQELREQLAESLFRNRGSVASAYLLGWMDRQT